MKNKVLKKDASGITGGGNDHVIRRLRTKKAGGKAGDGCDDRSDHVGRGLHRYRGRS